MSSTQHFWYCHSIEGGFCAWAPILNGFCVVEADDFRTLRERALLGLECYKPEWSAGDQPALVEFEVAELTVKRRVPIGWTEPRDFFRVCETLPISAVVQEINEIGAIKLAPQEMYVFPLGAARVETLSILEPRIRQIIQEAHRTGSWLGTEADAFFRVKRSHSTAT